MEECESSDSQSNFISPTEAKARGFKTRSEPREPIECKYCNQTLQDRGAVMPGAKLVMAWIGHETCSCNQAQAEKARETAERKAKEKREKEEAEQQARMNKLNKIFSNSGIGKRFKNRTFENFKIDKENEQSFRNAKLYAENFDRFKENGEGIYFSGNNGTGKTHLAVAIALYLMRKGTPVICMTSIKLLQEIRRTYDRNRNISEYQILETYKEVDLLVIDDLGQENITDWALAMLYDIINDRYERCLPTIVTTNLNDQELIGAWTLRNNDWTAKAIVSRLHEMTMGITVIGRDRRKDGN